MNKYLFTKKAAAKKLSVTYDTMTDLIEQGHVSTVTIGKRKLVTQAAIDSFLKSLQTV